MCSLELMDLAIPSPGPADDPSSHEHFPAAAAAGAAEAAKVS